MGIHLIGTVHYNLNGFDKLKKALEIENPDILTIEASREGVKYMKTHWDDDVKYSLEILKKNELKPETISFFKKYLESVSCYEVDACDNYSKEKNIPLYYIDSPDSFSYIKEDSIKQLNELFKNFEPNFFDKFSIEKIKNGHDKLYEYIQKLYDGEIPSEKGEEIFINPLRGKIVGKRDEFQAKKIVSIARENPGEKIVHVGGCVHFLSDSKGDTLYSKLKLNKINPTRKTLWKYEQDKK